MTSRQFIRWILKPIIWLGGLAPLGVLVLWTLTDRLGANPIEKITHRTGWWALSFLLVTLAVTPVRRLTGWNPLVQVRRLIGLFAFFYVALHFLIWLGIDQFFSVEDMVADIMERPYITVGFTGFLLLLSLALTSTRGMIRRLGRRWGQLHRLVYAAAGLGVLHFLWLVKADTTEPLSFGAVLLVLLVLRVPAVASFLGRGSAAAARRPAPVRDGSYTRSSMPRTPASSAQWAQQ